MKTILLTLILTFTLLQAKTITVCDLDTGDCKIIYVYGDEE